MARTRKRHKCNDVSYCFPALCNIFWAIATRNVIVKLNADEETLRSRYAVPSVTESPVTAQAYVFNATVVPTGALGYLTLWPDGATKPLVSTLNALDGSITNNMAIVPSTNGKVDAFASGITQLILDISSYFAP